VAAQLQMLANFFQARAPSIIARPSPAHPSTRFGPPAGLFFRSYRARPCCAAAHFARHAPVRFQSRCEPPAGLPSGRRVAAPSSLHRFPSLPNRITLLGPLSLLTLLDFRPSATSLCCSSSRSLRKLPLRRFGRSAICAAVVMYHGRGLRSRCLSRTRYLVERESRPSVRDLLRSDLFSIAFRSRDAPGTTCSTGRLTRR
jgi:hypothetical protein